MHTTYCLLSILTLSFVGPMAGAEKSSFSVLLDDIRHVTNRYTGDKKVLRGTKLLDFEQIKFSIPGRFAKLKPEEQRNLRKQFTEVIADSSDSKILNLLADR